MKEKFEQFIAIVQRENGASFESEVVENLRAVYYSGYMQAKKDSKEKPVSGVTGGDTQYTSSPKTSN